MAEQQQQIPENLKELKGLQKIQRGAFMTLKASGLVDPLDDEKYGQMTGNVLKSQGLVMVFAVFWARLLEIGNFKLPTKNRWVYYGGSVFLPSVFHALYCSSVINKFTNTMDEKYTQTYFDQYLGKIKQN